MPTIVDFPTIVKDAVDVFGDLFANEPARRHFAEYLTGLMVAEKKTVSGITGAFVVITDQSCLNRWLNEVTWDVKAQPFQYDHLCARSLAVEMCLPF